MRIYLNIFIISLVVFSHSFGQNKSNLELIDIFKMEYISEPKISPDGSKIVFVRNFKDVMTSEEITYKSLLICVWSIIRKHQYKNDILNVFNEQLIILNLEFYIILLYIF